MPKSRELTVKQLRAILAKLPQNAKIVTSSDEEGNGFNTISDVEVDKLADGKTAVILWAFQGVDIADVELEEDGDDDWTMPLDELRKKIVNN